MKDKPKDQIEDLRIGNLMKNFGFKPESSTSTARALILNLVRSAYGNEAARKFRRKKNLKKNRGVEASAVMDEFKRERDLARERSTTTPREIPGVGTEETQLSLFDVEKASGTFLNLTNDSTTFLQKKSRRA